MEGLLHPIMYLIIAFATLSIWNLLRRKLWWDVPFLVVLFLLVGCSIASLVRGESGLELALICIVVGFVITEIPGRWSKRVLWHRIRGEYTSAKRWSLATFLLQPTAYQYASWQMMRWIEQVAQGKLRLEDAQNKLQQLQPTVDKIHNLSLSLCLWETLYAFAATRSDWARLVRNYSPELLPLYSHPPSGAGYWMLQALCREGEIQKAATVLQDMELATQSSQMMPEESDAFHNKARLIYLAYQGDHKTLDILLRAGSPLRTLFTTRERQELLSLAHNPPPCQTPPTLSIEPLPDISSDSQLTQQDSEHISLHTAEEPDQDMPHALEESALEQEETATNVVWQEEALQELSQQIVQELQKESRLSHDYSLWSNATPATLAILCWNLLIFVWISWPTPWPGLGSWFQAMAWNTMDPLLLLRGGGCHPGIFEIGESWRLVSGNFLHAGIIHLGFNAYFLLFFGPTVERLLGVWRYIPIYLLSGLGGFALALFTGTDRILVGASASIFGVFGAAMMIIWLLRAELPTRWTQRQLTVGIVLFVLNTYLGLSVEMISFSAHIGGFVVGGMVAWCLFWLQTQNSSRWESMGRLSSVGLLVGLIAWSTPQMWLSSKQSPQSHVQKLLPMKQTAIPMFVSFFTYESYKQGNPALRLDILSWVSQLGATATPVFLLAMRDPEPKVIRTAEMWIAAQGTGIFSALLQALRHKDPEIRLVAAEVFSHSRWPKSQAVQALWRHITDPNPVVQTMVILALQQHQFHDLTQKQRQRLASLVQGNCGSKRRWTRINSLRLLAALEQDAQHTLPTLRDIFFHTKQRQEARLAGIALYRMGPLGIAVLQQATHAPNPQVRADAQMLLQIKLPSLR